MRNNTSLKIIDLWPSEKCTHVQAHFIFLSESYLDSAVLLSWIILKCLYKFNLWNLTNTETVFKLGKCISFIMLSHDDSDSQKQPCSYFPDEIIFINKSAEKQKQLYMKVPTYLWQGELSAVVLIKTIFSELHVHNKNWSSGRTLTPKLVHLIKTWRARWSKESHQHKHNGSVLWMVLSAFLLAP